MAEPLKNHFGPEVPVRIADMVEVTYPEFDRASFLDAALKGYLALELTPRARHISEALATHLPSDPADAIEILVESLGAQLPGAELTGMDGFMYLPYVFFVADYGLDCFETSMRAQYELTKRFTAEFSIRAYLERYPAKTLRRLHEWTKDPSVHVRRLVSEGSRPRLPWASRLRDFQRDPTPVLELLEKLKDDPEEYVRRSVANNLNDIAKDHPDRVIEVARSWAASPTPNRKKLLRHALRTLIKQGHPDALEVLGYGTTTPAVLRRVRCDPDRPKIGGKTRIEIELENPSDAPAPVLVDLKVHFVKSNGSTSPKVFKGAELEVVPGEISVIRKTISLAQHTTRKHYRGPHRVEVMINGLAHPGTSFEVL